MIGALNAVGLAVASGAGPASAATTAPASLNGVSCPSATFCMAVGATTPTMSTRLAAERWDGHRWRRLPVPRPAGVSFVGLDAVSCPSITECVAVGQGSKGSGAVPIAETWTHSGGWKPGKPVAPAGDGYTALNAISCPSAGLCYAAGQADEFGTVAADQLPLVERWTPRGGWARVPLPVVRGSSENVLFGISCQSATQCAAGGMYHSRTAQLGLIEQLAGVTWTARTAPKSTDGVLNGVSCPSTTMCVAVGTTLTGQNLAEQWSAGTWTAATPPGAGRFSGLDSISCASVTHCVAAGNTVAINGSGTAFVATLDGATWTRTAQTGPAFKVGQLNAVSCLPAAAAAPATGCTAIGGTTSVTATSRPLSAFLAAGTWSVVFTV